MSHPASTGFRSLAYMQGFSFAESSLAMALAVGLASLGLAAADSRGLELSMVQTELPGALHQAFSLARARGRNVSVALGDPSAQGILPVPLPPRVAWGKLDSIPVPRGMDAPRVAGRTGMAHRRITVTPSHTATASAWFVHDGREALCLRVSGHGHIQVLRWHRETRTWSLG